MSKLTSLEDWTPSSATFAEQEGRAVAKVVSKVTEPDAITDLRNVNRHIGSVLSTRQATTQCIELENDDHFTARIIAQVNVAPDDMAGDGLEGGTDKEIYTDARRIMKLSTTDRSSAITPEVLSTRWGIGIACEKSRH